MHSFADKPAPSILLTSYFGPLGDNLATAAAAPGCRVASRPGAGRRSARRAWRQHDRTDGCRLGVVDGRNVWRTDLRSALATLRVAGRGAGNTTVDGGSILQPAPCASRSGAGDRLDPDVKGWLAFATRSCRRSPHLPVDLTKEWPPSRRSLQGVTRQFAPPGRAVCVHRHEVAARLPPSRRPWNSAPAPTRSAAQRSSPRLNLPLFPTTTIGSFPQTSEVRQARAALVPRRRPTEADYDRASRAGSTTPCDGKRRSVSMCWCMANSSATTW